MCEQIEKRNTLFILFKICDLEEDVHMCIFRNASHFNVPKDKIKYAFAVHV
jgi:hypothetical protein